MRLSPVCLCLAKNPAAAAGARQWATLSVLVYGAPVESILQCGGAIVSAPGPAVSQAKPCRAQPQGDVAGVAGRPLYDCGAATGVYDCGAATGVATSAAATRRTGARAPATCLTALTGPPLPPALDQAPNHA